MTESIPFRFGIDTLLREYPHWIEGRRVGLVTHPAGVGIDGTPAADLLRSAIGDGLVCLFGPEHGYFGAAGAGEAVDSMRHPEWGIPIHSLYGDTRRPTAEMLEGIEVIVFDLQDLGARPYTYGATLRYLIEEAAARDIALIVADRPIPLPDAVDGPMLQSSFESFVSALPSPVVYGMTPGETALWLDSDLGLNADVRVARMRGYDRRASWPLPPERWRRPSPAIRDLECARCFPITVFFEALPAVDHGRQTDAPFQRLGAPWMRGVEVAEALSDMKPAGLDCEPETYSTPTGETFDGLRLRVSDPAALQPVFRGVALIHALQRLYGRERVWGHPETRPAFFDRLMGTDAVRLALETGEDVDAIAAAWSAPLAAFRERREVFRLY